jgi:very-short-patch-repair endonuclease
MAKTTTVSQLERRINKKMTTQFGLITREQALVAGMTRSMIEGRLIKERWVPVIKGIYKVGGAPPSFKQKLMAALLWAGEGAIASGRSAARVWRLEGEFDGAIEITTQKSSKPPPGIIVYRRKLEPADITKVGVFPMTKVARTLFDLASVVPLNQLLIARDDALTRRLTNWKQLSEQPRGVSRGCKGTVAFKASLTGDNRGSSDLERLFLRFARQFGLPPPSLQYELQLRDGSTVFIDFAYPNAKLAIETDGSRHDQPVRAKRDRKRDNSLLVIGWGTMRLSRDDILYRPAEVAKQILDCLT